jgi:hypothetical protein
MSLKTTISRVLTDKAVYWGNPTNTGAGIEFDSPVQINCRWTVIKQKVKNKLGDEIISKAAVLTDTELQEGGMLWLGELADLSSGFVENVDGREIIEIRKLKSLYNEQQVQMAYLR